MTEDAIGAIALSFGAGAAVGRGAEDGALAVAGMPRRDCRPRVFPFMLPPGSLTGTSVGSFQDLPDQWGPPMGWFWDITSITLAGFTAGQVVVTRNFPYVTAAGTPVAVEIVTPFNVAGTIQFPQHGNPLLDANDRLVFTVSSAITGGPVAISGTVIAIPASRIDEYLS